MYSTVSETVRSRVQHRWYILPSTASIWIGSSVIIDFVSRFFFIVCMSQYSILVSVSYLANCAFYVILYTLYGNLILE